MSWIIAVILRPFVALLVLWLICWPIKKWVWMHLRDGRLKRILFYSWKV